MKITVTPEQFERLKQAESKAARNRLDGASDEGYWFQAVRAILHDDPAVQPFAVIEIVVDWTDSPRFINPILADLKRLNT